MLNSFLTAFNAVMPFLIYLGIGFMIVRTGLADIPFMNRLNKMTFQVIFPFMMFNNIYSAAPDAMPSVTLIVTAVVSVLVWIGILMLTVPRLVRENPRRGVIIQAIYRSNIVIYGIPLATYVFGTEKAAIASMLVIAVVTTYNITAVIVLETFNGKERVKLRTLLLRLVKNPLLQGCMVGLLFFLLHIRLPSFLSTPVSSLAGMATPLALITLGGTLQFRAIRKNLKTLITVLSIKLILLPLFMVVFAYTVIGLRGVELFLILMIYATPVAATSYPMAVNMGGDGELAGQLVFLSTVVSLLTVFLFIFSMSQMGLLV